MECRLAERLMTRFGDRTSFLTKCNPSVQTDFGRNPRACITGEYPTLTDLAITYGKTMAIQWLVPQLTDLSIFSGAKNLTLEQLEQLARVIATAYPWLKVTELLLFFFRFKTGRYGRFYGTVDPLVVTTALREFIEERNALIDQYEREDENKKREQQNALPTMNYEEWQEYKKKQAVTSET